MRTITITALIALAGAGAQARINPMQPQNNGLRVCVRSSTLISPIPSVLSYALPVEGVHIVVFTDRVLELAGENRTVTALLVHVLAHEITHVPQGTGSHSAKGIMKANRDASALATMGWRSLAFTPQDISLIRMGMQKRPRARALRDADGF